MRRDTIVRITSMTKPIRAAATKIPIDECKLRLDESVDARLPELAERRGSKRRLRADHGAARCVSDPEGCERAADSISSTAQNI
jgi:CubicO group peptidase (beta-lactamase class C family)